MIKEGSYWLDREMTVHGPILINEHGNLYVFPRLDTKEQFDWYSDGKYYAYEISPYDLIEEVEKI